MHYIVLDLEWNQPYSYRTTLKHPVFLYGEIIQIGAIKLSENFRITDSFCIDIAPKYYTRMNPSVAKVIRMTQYDMNRATDFKTAFSRFVEWCGTDFCFLIWGDGDIRMLASNMKLYDMDTAWLPPQYNLQIPFSQQISFEKKACSLTKAVAMVQEKLEDAHDAVSDARATAMLCRHLDMDRALLEYDPYYFRSADICVESFTAEDDYLDIEDALDDDYVSSFECPNCGEIVWCDQWIHEEPAKIICLCRCESEQIDFFARLKFSSAPHGLTKVRRTVFLLSEAHLSHYRECEENQCSSAAMTV